MHVGMRQISVIHVVMNSQPNQNMAAKFQSGAKQHGSTCQSKPEQELEELRASCSSQLLQL